MLSALVLEGYALASALWLVCLCQEDRIEPLCRTTFSLLRFE